MTGRGLRAILTAGAVALALTACGGLPAPPVSSQAAPDTALNVSVPTGIELPTLKAQSSLIPVALNADGTLEVPDVEHPLQAAYYRLGPLPGAPGPAIVIGHVNGGGQQGIFARLHDMQPGDRVLIDEPSGPPLIFEAYRSDLYSKVVFPWERVTARTDGPELRLITCDGKLDTHLHSYESNRVVYLKLVTS